MLDFVIIVASCDRLFSGLQNRELLQNLLASVTKARDELEPSTITGRRPRLVLKVAPDLEESQIVDIAELIRSSNIDGVIVSNTTISRPASLRDRKSCRHCFFPKPHRCDVIANKSETGGLSGVPVKPLTLHVLKTLRTHLPSSIPLIGCGGISTGADVLEYGRAGASLIQVYTSFGYDGAGTCRRIKDELESLLRAENTTWKAVVDHSVKKLSWTE